MTALRQIADKCAFDETGDRIIFAIANNKVGEKLLLESELSLTKTLDICRASEMSQAKIRQ